MANYKLKYSGEKIDELLGKIDDIDIGKIKDQFKTVTAAFTVDGWTSVSGKFTQSKTVTNREAFTIKNVLPPLTTQTGNAATDATKRRNLGTISRAKAEFTVTESNITVKITADTKPDCDLDVVWYLEV